MTNTDNNPVRLIVVPTEHEAAMIVAELERQGIESRLVGDMTASFRADAPGYVTVQVRVADLQRAKDAIEAVQAAPWEYPSSTFDQPENSVFRKLCLLLLTAGFAIHFGAGILLWIWEGTSR